MSIRITSPVAVLTLVCCVSLSSAATFTWSQPAFGIFESSGSWGGDGVPGPKDTARLGATIVTAPVGGSPITVQFDTDETNSDTDLFAGDYEFRWGNPGLTYTLTDILDIGMDSGDPAIPNQASLNIGKTGFGEFAGTLATARSRIGREAGYSASVTLTGGGNMWNNGGDLTVGDGGEGALVVQDEGVVASSTGSVGRSEGGVGVVIIDGVGAAWNLTGELNVGDVGQGTLNISGGGTVTSGSNHTYIGRRNWWADAYGEVNISGSGSTWDVSSGNNFHVGFQGTGSLSIDTEGEVLCVTPVIGNAIDSQGVVSVMNSSRMTATGNLTVGSSGHGTLTIESGGLVSSAQASIGQNNGSTGTATITDAGSRWEVGDELSVGKDGMGSLSINNGGSLHVADEPAYIGARTTGAGNVSISGVDSELTGISQLYVGGTMFAGDTGDGILTVFHGAALESVSAKIASQSGANGSATISGVGASWTNAENLTIGEQGQGTLIIQNGGKVTSGVLTVSLSGPGMLRITDGAVAEAATQLTIGSMGVVEGDGEIIGNVVNGGLVSPGASQGTLTVTGDFVQQSSGQLAVELDTNSTYDSLAVSGFADIGGELHLSLVSVFEPAYGDQFVILSADDGIHGQFDTITGSQIAPNKALAVVTNSTDLIVTTVIPGDANTDGVVDASDFDIWNANKFTAGSGWGSGDYNYDGSVDVSDFNIWNSHKFTTADGMTVVAEPETSLLLVVASCLLLARRIRPEGVRQNRRNLLRSYWPFQFRYEASANGRLQHGQCWSNPRAKAEKAVG